MGDLYDLVAANSAPELISQRPIDGQVEVALREQRLVAEPNAGSALDIAGLIELGDDDPGKRRQERAVALPVAFADCILDSRPQAIGSRHHNEHWLSPSRAEPARRVVDVFADGCLTSRRQDNGISRQS